MSHVYNNTFFDYIDAGAQSSARAFTSLLMDWLKPASVLDLGCGRGVWLGEWQAAGAKTVLGVDGDYVDRAQLAIPKDSFRAEDLTKPLTFDRRFDLAQSLEVGEHLPTEASDALVGSLCAGSDRVLFSAAVPGQGGEFHINEQPLSFWQEKFEAHGYRAYDCIRPHLTGNQNVEPWYRYNAILYVNDEGAKSLPDAVLKHAVPRGEKVQNAGHLGWRLRRAVVRHLPQRTVTQIAQTRAAVLAARARRQVQTQA